MLPFCDRVVNVPRSRYLPAHNRGIPIPRNPSTIGGHLRRRRLQLGIHQSQAARLLGVSMVTLSRWECDKVYPTWAQQSRVIAYLGYNPFLNPALGGPNSNKSSDVAFLSSDSSKNIGAQLLEYRLELRKTRNQMASELGISVKTLWRWETNRRQPSPLYWTRIAYLFGFDPRK